MVTIKNKGLMLMSVALLMLCILVTGVQAAPAVSTALANSGATGSQIKLGYSSYEMGDNENYPVAAYDNTTALSFGDSSLIDISVKGSVEEINYNGQKAIKVVGGSAVSLRLDYRYGMTNINKSDWNISGDSARDPYNGGVIGSGSLTLQRSLDGVNWSNVHYNVDVQKNYPNGVDFCTLGHSDLGYYYRTIYNFETYIVRSRQVQKSKFHFYLVYWYTEYWWETEYYNEYKNISYIGDSVLIAHDVQEPITIKNLTVSSYDYSSHFSDDEKPSEEQIELIKKGETLQNGSCTSTGFKLDFNGVNGYYVLVSYNDGGFEEASSGQKFNQQGKYIVRTISKFGTLIDRTIYVLPSIEDAYISYFGSGLFSGKRLFHPTSIVPVFQTNLSYYEINKISPYMPLLQGEIINDTSGVALTLDQTRDLKHSVLTEEGVYVAEFYIGDQTLAGDHYRFVFYSMVVSEPYLPSVNLDNLYSADRGTYMFQTAAYVVNYVTDGGGAYEFLFLNTSAGYDAALSLALKLESRHIQEYDNRTYYKSIDNANSFIYYPNDIRGTIDLYSSLMHHAEQRIYKSYLVANEPYTTLRLSEDVEDVTLSPISINTKCFMNEEYRDAFMACGLPYLNGFVFSQIDPLESYTVTAKNELGQEAGIEYGVDVGAQLSSLGWNSSIVVITEKNIYGDGRTFDAIFVSVTDNTVEFEVGYLFESANGNVSLAPDNEPLICNDLNELLISDFYDNQLVVRIYQDSRLIFTGATSEVEAFGFTIGEYTLETISRLGKSNMYYFELVPPPAPIEEEPLLEPDEDIATTDEEEDKTTIEVEEDKTTSDEGADESANEDTYTVGNQEETEDIIKEEIVEQTKPDDKSIEKIESIGTSNSVKEGAVDTTSNSGNTSDFKREIMLVCGTSGIFGIILIALKLIKRRKV